VFVCFCLFVVKIGSVALRDRWWGSKMRVQDDILGFGDSVQVRSRLKS